MKLSTILGVSVLALANTVSAESELSDKVAESIRKLAASYGTSLGSTCACNVLKFHYKDRVLFPGSAEYVKEANYHWDLRSDLSPKCVFTPASEIEVAGGTLAMNLCRSVFAIRSGGHMPVKGAANTDGGVLLATNNLKTLKLGSEENTVESGAANDWYTLNKFLEPHGKIVVGGRLKTIGTSGLTIGGGISYFTAKYGFAMDNVVAYEIVIASGKIVTASATSNPDLFWAMKGGGSNFGIVTKFTFATYDVPKVSTAIQIFLEPSVPAYISAVVNLAKYQDQVDTGAGGVFSTGFTPSTGAVQAQFLGVQAGNQVKPEVFANFTSIPSAIAVHNVTTLAAWSATLDTPYQTKRYLYGFRAMVADDAAVQAMWTTFKADATANMKTVAGFSCNLVFQPIPKSATTVAKINGIGNIWDVDNTKPYIYWLITSSWDNAADDDKVMSWSAALREKMHAMNAKLGLAENLIYMNDASDDQKPFQSIPKANLERLKVIRKKYDPTLVFRNLNNGGYKLD